MEVTLEIVVRPTEIDVNGHVNNTKYVEYLEWGREEWYERADLDYDTFTRMGIQTVTVNININYRKECRQGEKLIIITSPNKVGRTSYVMEQKIRNEAGEIVADAMVTCVTMGMKSRRSVEVPAALRKWFD